MVTLNVKAERLNFCATIRNAITARGNSVEQIRGAVNSRLNDRKVRESDTEIETAPTKTKGKGENAVSTNRTSVELVWEAKSVNVVDRFDNYAGEIAKLEKKFGEFTIAFPAMFDEWLDGMKERAEKKSEKSEKIPEPATK